MKRRKVIHEWTPKYLDIHHWKTIQALTSAFGTIQATGYVIKKEKVVKKDGD